MVLAEGLKSATGATDARDLVQDAFVQAYTRLHQLEDPARFAGWLRRIAVNLNKRRHAKEPAWVPLEASGLPGLVEGQAAASQKTEPRLGPPEVALERLATRDLVRRALDALPEKLRSAADLHYLQGFNLQEIAAALAVPHGTIKRRLHDARRSLRKEVMHMADTAVLLKHAVGLETTGRQHTPVFVRGMHLPVRWTKMLSTGADDQEEIEVHLMQGDSTRADECRTIEMFKIRGIAPGQKRGEPKLRMTLEINPKGQVNFRVCDTAGEELEVVGNPERVHTQEETGFSGYGGMWGVWYGRHA